MDRNQVDRAVLVQPKGAFDNGYLLDCLRRFPDRLAAVGIVDVGRQDAVMILECLVEQGLQGIRLSSTDDLSSPHGLAVLRRAEELNLVVSWLDSLPQLASADFHAIVAARPNLRIMIEHLGILHLDHLGILHPTTPLSQEEFASVLSLADYPNVFMKVPGFGELMPRPMPMTHPAFDLSKVPPYLEMVRKAFGASRMTIATDYPPCSAREGYGNVVGCLREYVAGWDVEEQEAILGGTAASLFSFSLRD